MKFVVSDFSAIEARVLSWFASEKWRLDVFKSGGDIYCASASRCSVSPLKSMVSMDICGRKVKKSQSWRSVMAVRSAL